MGVLAFGRNRELLPRLHSAETEREERERERENEPVPGELMTSLLMLSDLLPQSHTG
jgi:hypothetical protein